MSRRPKPHDPSPAEIEEAFARNIAWLGKFGRVLPRRLVETEIGDYRGRPHVAPHVARSCRELFGKPGNPGDRVAVGCDMSSYSCSIVGG